MEDVQKLEVFYLHYWSPLHFLAGVASGILFPEMRLIEYVMGHIIWQMIVRTERWEWKGLIGDIILGTFGFFLVKTNRIILLK
jgi:hypothetical protein